MVMISLLQLPLELAPGSPARMTDTDTFLTGLPEYLLRCTWVQFDRVARAEEMIGQTFEGGISGAPGNEAHGAYAFCALACLSIIGHPRETITKSVLSPRSVTSISTTSLHRAKSC